MGARISYYIIRKRVGLEELLAKYFDVFRSWYLETDRISRQEFNEPFGDERLIEYLARHGKIDNIHELAPRLMN